TVGSQPVDEGDAPRHPRTEVASRGTQDDRDAPGHVLERVVAHTLGDTRGARIAHEEALADDTADVDAPARGSVADDVAGRDIGLCDHRGSRVGSDDDVSPGEPLADEVVRVAVESHGHASREE